MTNEPVHLHNSATLFHTRAGDMTLGISWLATDLARDAGVPLVVEVTSDREVDGFRYHLQCYVNLDENLRPRSIAGEHAFHQEPTQARSSDAEARRESVRLAWAADVASLAPELISPREVLRLYRYGAKARLKAAEADVRAARQKLAYAEEAARRAAVIRDEAYGHKGHQA